MATETPTASATADACPISPVVDLVFSRWTTPILWTLNESGVLRFVELERRLGAITSKVLTQRLRQLERDGLVQRHYHPEVPPRVEYEITPPRPESFDGVRGAGRVVGRSPARGRRGQGRL